MKIIHLTDLHLKAERNAETNRRFRKVVERLNGDDFVAADHIVVITGDLIDNAYHRGAIDQVKEHLKLLQPKYDGRIFVCSGNHDFGSFTGGNSRFIPDFFNTFESYLESKIGLQRTDYLDSEMLTFQINGERVKSPFPVVNEIDGCVLIGLDTMEGEFADDGDGRELGAEGKLGSRQMVALKRLLNHQYLNGKKVVVYLHHHPYKNKIIMNKFRDAAEFRGIINGKVDVLLFGHNHHFEDVSDEAAGVSMAVDGGSIKQVIGGQINFRVIHMDNDEPSYTIKKSQAHHIGWD